jgi:hypothetical protein
MMNRILRLQEDIASLQQATIDIQRMLIQLQDQFDKLENEVRHQGMNQALRNSQ